MEDYIVSARKYRPMSFDSVVGQTALTTTLKNTVKSGKLAHAYLFCGPRGVGKTTCARIFAKAINCMTPTKDGEACNSCESCKAFNEQRSYNIFELDAASNNGVEHIKVLMEQTRIPPQVGKYKVFIIDEVHMLSTQAFNAFLKTLEEPPAHVIFILATTEKHKILPTIISRCQIYDFERMTVQNIIGHLKAVASKENVAYEEEALAVIAEKADGGMRDALSIFDQAVSFCGGNITYQKVIEDLNVLDSENYFKIIDLSLENKVSELMVLVNSIISKGFDGGNLVLGTASHVRNVLMAKDVQTVSLLEVSKAQQEKLKVQAQKCPAKFLYDALKIMNQCDIAYRQSSNKRLLVELTLIQVAQLTQPDEDSAGAGRSPKRLKSLFKKLVSDLKSSTAATQVAATEGRETTNKHTPTLAGSRTFAQSAPSVAKPTAPKPLKLGNIGVSFAQLRKQNNAETQQSEPEIVNKDERSAFTQETLEDEWRKMCRRMPHEMSAISSSMLNMTPHIKTDTDIELVVDNDILLQQLISIKGRIRATLAKTLRNGNITLDIRLSKDGEVRKVLSRKEIIEKLRSENAAFAKLYKSLNLVPV